MAFPEKQDAGYPGTSYNTRCGYNNIASPSPHRFLSSLDPLLTRQTVRWRFARAPPGKTRRGVLYHLIRNDIFHLRSAEAGKEGRLLGARNR